MIPMNNNTHLFRRRRVPLVLLLAGVLLTGSCKKYADPPQVYEQADAVKIKKKRKVMLIVLEGATGQEISKVMPPTIKQMLANSKYTWNAISDPVTNDPATLSSIMRGVASMKHQFTDSTFELNASAGEHDVVPVYPTFIQRLQDLGKIRKSTAVTSWKKLSDNLLIYADDPFTVANDAAVKDKIIDRLNTQNDDLLVADFNGINLAGISSGFSADAVAYKDAIVKTDTYIGNILEAIKVRKSYDKEDWLVAVTSSHGGNGNSYGGNSTAERNIFALYYSPSFKSTELAAPPQVEVVRLQGKDATAINAKVAAANADRYNLKSKGEFTIQLKLKIYNKGVTQPAFFTKYANTTGAQPGWAFMFQAAGEWRVIIGANGKALQYLTGKNLPLNEWHVLTLKVYEENGKRYGVVYTDGEKHAPTDITGYDVTNTADLVAGFNPGYVSTGPVLSMADIRFYNTALPDNVIGSLPCAQPVGAADPYNNNLIGYWPCTDGLGGVMKDMSASKANLLLNGSYAWEFSEAYSCGPRKEYLLTNVIQNTDLFPQIIYWFGGKVDDAWKLDGKVWLDKFESEFVQ